MKLEKRFYNIKSDRSPKTFDGFKILQISDLHSRKVDDSFFKQIDGDIIVLTGDIMDGRIGDANRITEFVMRLAQIAPVYYITGNHEGSDISIFYIIEKNLSRIENVRILHDEVVNIEKDGEKIQLIGLDDLKYLKAISGKEEIYPDDRLKNFDMTKYSIVLLHSPNNIETMAEYSPDLVLCGHTHGGQWRLPHFRAIYAPGQGLFPKYDRGQYLVRNTDVIISSGIGYSRIPLRINCPAEISSIVLHNKFMQHGR